MEQQLTKKALQLLDQQIEHAYYRHAHGVRISVLDIPKLFRDCRTMILAGQNLDDAVKGASIQYRRN